jgi:apolipoprotein N-acyltransferase
MWFLTGFPWLYLGYAHIDTWLAGWAPVAGVFCLSFLTVCTGLAISELGRFAIRKMNKNRTVAITATQFTETRLTKKGFSQASCALSFVFILAFWVSGYFLHAYSWTQKQTETPLKIGIVQPNIPQHYKWEPYYYPYIMQTMRDLSSDAWQKVDLLLWPENAIPLFYHEANDYREELAQRAEASQTALITGILYDADEPRTWYNGIIGLGLAEGTYFKQRLVPFGEYVPMEDLLRGTIRFFNLPHSLITGGPAGQAPLKMGESTLASSICYEVVYPDLVAEYADHSALLLTISNDAWFGNSIGPIQHFQMAQMRALENGKYMLRATNNGVSGVISEKGQILSTLPHFEQGTLLQDIYLMQGHTPFSRWKSWPIVFVCMLGVILVAITKQTENGESINLS